MLQHPHARAAVMMIFVDIGNFSSEHIFRVEFVYIGLNAVIENEPAVSVGHENSKVQITEQAEEIELAEIKVTFEKAGKRVVFHIHQLVGLS